MTIPNISISQFLKLEDPSEYEALTFLKGRPEFVGKKAKPVEELKWGEVMELREGLVGPETNKAMIRAFRLIFKATEKEVLNSKVVDFYYAANWILSEFERLANAEKNISGEDEQDAKWIAAGGDVMNKYRHFNVMMNLAIQFGVTPQEIEEWKYGLVFLILKYNADKARIEKRYMEMMTKR